MLQALILLFLGLTAQDVGALTEAPEQAKRCDQKSVLTIRTKCQSCTYTSALDCPDGYTKVTKGGPGVRDCRYRFVHEAKGYTMSLPGCRHICKKDYMQPQCCPGHWGPDCMECPGGASSPCGGRGSCADGMEGDGRCTCQDGFDGTACETCADSHHFGPNCTSECSCVHGVCDSGLTGSGTCECHSAYTGPNCDQPIPACAALLCPDHARCVPSGDDGTKLECKCLPGYKGDGDVCAPINPCSQNVCPLHAQCTYLGPNRHRCTCQEGYHGDGQVCLPVDPCQDNFGGCPPQSTVCKYDGPAQSHCACREHYHDFVPGVGCSMADVCASQNPCHPRANCTTIAPGQTRCTCQEGYVGDGAKCYGNILERLRELNVEPGGKWQGRLTAFASLLDKAYGWPLSNLGPFTVLVTTDKGLKGLNVKDLTMDTQAAQYFVKLHIIAGQMSSEQMSNTSTFYTLAGKAGEIFSSDKDNAPKLKLFGGKRKVRIVQGNIVASNGLLHILDKALDSLEPSFKSNTEQTIMAMLQPRYSKFRSLLEKTNTGQALEEDGAGDPYTIFVPRNEALDAMKAGALDYLLSAQGSRKLLELVRYHIVPFTQLEVASVISAPSIRTMANQMLQFNVTSQGQILVNGVAVGDTEVAAQNGRIYTLNGVLIPPSIVPILPHRCDETKMEMKLGTCLTCSLMHLSKCPAGTEPTMIFTHSCASRGRVRILKGGCARYCNATVTVPQCCPGFYGPDCNQCPGGFMNPCSGNGQCSDGVDGNGSCACKDGFHGSRCQFCSDPTRYGPGCDRKCLCVYGTCDNRVDSDGACWPGTCRNDSAGRFCRKHTSTCGPLVQLCHAHATCEYSNGTASCVCKAGYRGDGRVCTETDPCVELFPGGCDPNAECLPTGAGTHTCVCRQGWTGDGRDCSEINPCLLPTKGGCHRNATCLYVGPGQHECACNKGFQGSGTDCEPVTSCWGQTGMCHPLATCQLASSGVWSCVCREGYEGDGLLCCGNAAVELLFLSEAARFNQWVNNASLRSLLSTTSNLTILVPSLQAIEDMDQAEKDFWLSKSNIPALIKHHMLPGTYGVADLLALSSSHMLATSLQGNFLRLAKADGNITLNGASIINGDNTATNGVIHIINKVLLPQNGLGGSLPSLLTRLEQMPDYSIFRNYMSHYNLASTIEAAQAYTVFAPNNDAIENYIREKKAATLEENVLRYHVILEEKLLKNDLHNGMHRKTMLGVSYMLGFFLRDGQLYVNEAPINDTNIATDKGVIHGLTKVLEIQKNRCDSNNTVIVRGKCGICSQKPPCPLGTKPHGEEVRKCITSSYFKGKRSVFIGCQAVCAKTIINTACCAGYFGSQCQACPGNGRDICYGNGVCLDGLNGTGTCVCDDSFSGTACETCHEGKYGIHCDQECPCVHGRCSQGISGDGSCACDVGWRGVTCDQEITKDSCNGTCHTSANCLLGPDGSASCQCAAGFQGNGTTCVATNPCETRNGGCSAKADCKRTTPGNRLCLCREGYTGDGIVCLEINPCLVNNGGCHPNAECTQTGPNKAVCNCLPKYTGDGRTCLLINSCLTNNGGCSQFAICNHTGPDERTCKCKPNYVGDGFTCRGNIYQELPRDPKTSQYFFQLMQYSIRDLVGPGPFTVFVPSSATFDEETRLSNWSRHGVMTEILRYHVIGCHQLDLETLKRTPNATSLQGDMLFIRESEDTVYINNDAKVLFSDIINTNGIIHIIDKLLTPQNLLFDLADASGRLLHNITTVATKFGYVEFSHLIQDVGLLELITDPIHTPVTLFWPSDRTLQALPAEKRDFLFNPSNRDKLKEYLKFHVIRDAKVVAADLPRTSAWKTLQGSELRVKCGADGHLGELFLNDQNCRIVQRYIPFNLGVVYGIDCLLIDPTLGGRCDIFTTFNVSGDCGSCLGTPSCPRWSKPKGVKRRCQYNLPYRRNLEGCQHLCALVIQLPRCCKGYFGRDCQACPGGPDTPCNNRGVCLDQYWSTGECKCIKGFNGTACELCEQGRFGPDCQPCSCSSHGQCDEGIMGSGLCLCETGWTGRFCDTPLTLAPVCTPPCSVHATCKENNTCECGLNYEGDGVTCTVVDFCAQDNGGCAKVATCSQKDTQVSCTCPKGYSGDGRNCVEIDPCADGFNGGCHEHATCTMTGPGKQKCKCKAHYVGDGVDCEPEQLPVDRCLQDHGQCHADADCTDLHFQDSTLGVFHLRSPKGQYKLTFDKAREACAEEAATVATYNQLSYAQKAMYHLCSAGWLQDGRVAYPTAFASKKCGSGVVGIVDYGPRNNKSELWDVFCFRMKDVNCTCKAGYVGDGISCSGNLLQVLMSRPSLTHFLTEVLAYSNSSSRGRAFLKRLSDLSVRGTLFVPQNEGLRADEVLSGRDIEHHLSNLSVFYDDLVNGTALRTRLGSQLHVTSRQEPQQPETRFVDGRSILQWDLVASNGIIHIISGPLKAPPAPGHAGHTGLGLGVFSAILLVIGAIALAAYSYFRVNRRAIGFQHFESEEDIDVSALGKQQEPENITNPMYESRTSAPPAPSYDPFTEADEQQLDSADPLGAL